MSTISSKSSTKNLNICLLGLFTAIMLFCGILFPALGYIGIGPLKITFLPVFVAIGSALMGWKAGLYLGTLFGLTSLYLAYTMDTLGQLMFGINEFYTFIVVVVSRMLMGLLTGIIADTVKRFKKGTFSEIMGYGIISLSSSLLNTIFFVGTLILLFGTNQEVLDVFGASSVWGIIVALVTVNAAVEIAFSLLVGTSLTKAICQITHKIIKER